MSDHLISRVWNAVTNSLRTEITVAGTAINTTTNRLPVDALHPTALSTISHGERAGSITAVQLASVAAKYVKLKAPGYGGNAGNVYVGSSAAVTKAAGTTTTTCGFRLSPGEDTGWIPASNLNLFWIICDNASDHLTYMVAN